MLFFSKPSVADYAGRMELRFRWRSLRNEWGRYVYRMDHLGQEQSWWTWYTP